MSDNNESRELIRLPFDGKCRICFSKLPAGSTFAGSATEVGGIVLEAKFKCPRCSAKLGFQKDSDRSNKPLGALIIQSVESRVIGDECATEKAVKYDERERFSPSIDNEDAPFESSNIVDRERVLNDRARSKVRMLRRSFGTVLDTESKTRRSKRIKMAHVPGSIVRTAPRSPREENAVTIVRKHQKRIHD